MTRQPTKGTVLITNGEQRAALSVVRSLGRAGYRVYVCSASGKTIAGASRHCLGEGRVTDPVVNASHFFANVKALLERWGCDTLVPISEASLLAILPRRDDLPGVTVPFADVETFRRVSDKRLVTETAPTVGIAVPQQRVLRTPEDRQTLERTTVEFPLVVKPSRSVVEANPRARGGVRHAANWTELQTVLDELEESYPLLLQQRIIGPGVGIFLLVWDGEIVAQFAHRRIREKPPSGGVSVYRESIPAEPSLVARSHALLRALDWQGVAMVEYKIDEATGTPYLMEINGRFWGSLQLAVDAGVDFPRLLVERARGDRVTPVTEYESGVRLRWLWGDVDHLWARLRRSREELALPPGAPGRGRAVFDFLPRFGPKEKSEVLRVGDIKPFLRESAQWFRRQ